MVLNRLTGDETEQEDSAPMSALEQPDRGLLKLDGLGSGDAPIAGNYFGPD